MIWTSIFFQTVKKNNFYISDNFSKNMYTSYFLNMQKISNKQIKVLFFPTEVIEKYEFMNFQSPNK